MRKLVFLFCFIFCTAAICQDFPAAMEGLEVLQSPYDESHPVMSADGKTIYFSRKGHPQNMGDDGHYDIWMAFRQNEDRWSKAVNIPAPINNRNDNFVVAASADGRTLFLNDAYALSESGLVYTKKKGRSWSKPIPITIKKFNKTRQTSFSLADNGKTLLLTEKSSAGYGGRDIYVATQIDEQNWSEPINMGGLINSTREEFHACLAADNKTLYFLSNGFSDPTLLTLMVSQRQGDNWTDWSEPESTGIELDPTRIKAVFSIEPDGEYLYCAGKSEAEDKQLIRIAIPDKHQPEPTALVVGELVDARTGASLHGNIRMESLIGNGKALKQSTNRRGRFQFILPYQEQFNLSAEVPGYYAKSESIGGRSLQELDEESGLGNNNTFRVSPQADELQVRLQQLNKSMQELAEQREVMKHNSLNTRRRTSLKPKGGDVQLEALKQKYHKAIGIESVESEKSSSGDSELDAMKRAFRKHNDVRDEETKPNSEFSTKGNEETQLEAMKRKYNEANNNKASAEREEVVVASTVELPSSFTALVEQSRADLEKELNERVVRELRADLLQEVSFKMNAKLDDEVRDQYAGTLQRQTDKLESDARKALRKKYKTETKRELKGELIEVVEEELRILLREEVKRELRESLKAEVREELRLELKYLLTKEMAENVRKELTVLFKQLKKEVASAPAAYYKAGDLEEATQTKGATGKNDSGKVTIQLYPLRSGQIIPLDNIYFEANSAVWKDSALPELKRLYKLLDDNQNLKIEIGGHANGWCSAEFADRLSESRAKAVAGYLVDRGIEREKIRWKGYGKRQPLVPNDSVENCKKNQRLELKIL